MENNFTIEQIQQLASRFSGFTGQVYPKPKNIYSHAPVIEKELEVGKDERKCTFTKVKFWVHEPTMAFPEYACFISLNNRHSTFFKLRSITEIDNLIEWLDQCRAEFLERQPTLEASQENMRKALEAYANTLAATNPDQSRSQILGQ